MDIGNRLGRKKVFRNNLGTYDLTLCRWKGLNSTLSRRKEICNLDRQGYVHAAAKLKDTIYTIIGPDEHQPTQVPLPLSRPCTPLISEAVSGGSGLIATFPRAEIPSG